MVFLSGDGDSSATVPAQDGPGASLAITVAAVSDERGHRTGMLQEHFLFGGLHLARLDHSFLAIGIDFQAGDG